MSTLTWQKQGDEYTYEIRGINHVEFQFLLASLPEKPRIESADDLLIFIKDNAKKLKLSEHVSFIIKKNDKEHNGPHGEPAYREYNSETWVIIRVDYHEGGERVNGPDEAAIMHFDPRTGLLGKALFVKDGSIARGTYPNRRDNEWTREQIAAYNAPRIVKQINVPEGVNLKLDI